MSDYKINKTLGGEPFSVSVYIRGESLILAPSQAVAIIRAAAV